MATHDAFPSLDAATLATVTGGRLIASKGPDPKVIRGIQALAQAVVEVGQQLTVTKQASSQQLMQVMQQLAGRGR